MAEEQKNKSAENHNKEVPDTPSSHEYDGIVELNNPSPKWIIIIFYVTIAFSLLYAIHYFGYPGNKKDQYSEYERKVTAFEEEQSAREAVTSDAEEELSNEENFAEGSKLYAEKGCLACHGASGEGNAIGPNLTDNYWIHGCTEEEVIKVITEGIPAKGMTPYKSMMSQKQIEQLSKFILGSMVGSAPANAKDAQGEECK
jgi:cytochrome c oxidase cbb3-type subunit 3